MRFRVADVTDALRERLGCLPDARLVERDDRPLEIVCRDVEQTLVAVVNIMGDLVDLLELEATTWACLDLTRNSLRGLKSAWPGGIAMVIWTLAKKDLRLLRALVILIAMPFLFILVLARSAKLGEA